MLMPCLTKKNIEDCICADAKTDNLDVRLQDGCVLLYAVLHKNSLSDKLKQLEFWLFYFRYVHRKANSKFWSSTELTE
jgi:hypothetical protein